MGFVGSHGLQKAKQQWDLVASRYEKNCCKLSFSCQLQGLTLTLVFQNVK